VFLPMLDSSHDVFTYSTTSGGGRDCLANLLDAWVQNKMAHPEDANKLPMVTLSSDSYVHSEYGKINVPMLEIDEWVEPPANLKSVIPPASSSALMLVDQGGGGGKLIEHHEQESENPGSDFDDDIPY
jgi:hypothetical protein